MTFVIVLLLLLALLYTGIPMFSGMFLFSGAVLLYFFGNVGTLGEFVFEKLNVYLLVAIPLFMLMAHFMVRGKVVDDLYDTAHTLVRHLPGGLGIATVFACAVFAAISGSSVATALTVGKVAIPQMLRYNYDRLGAYGVVAGGGTLGILIPPSAPMVLYGFVSDTSIGALFMAGVVPGLLLAAIFAVYCMVTEGRRERRLGPAYVRPARASGPEMGTALRRSFWALTLPPFVLLGIYFGVFTATEAAGTGALWALLIAAVIYKTLGWRDLWAGAQEAARTTAMLFMIIIGAALFGYMLTKLRIPQELVELVVRHDIGKYPFLIAMMALIFVLGLVLESISIILITTPIVLPVLKALGIEPVWYGVLLTINLELALISPPVAMNLVVIKSITGAPLKDIDRAAIPYMVMMGLFMLLIIAVPGIATWLPGTMFGQ
ncbi:TRAP transporter large permease [Reyranella sp. CPCC 100927]|uniref:TRAP transporter large permease n=1 Tax=Reyranella sp. CPCC 100927 TaxID=2599616 RepID=UPI0011B46D1D|nr:TRAP transporter large permease [Reyranella sp. CPCC 100927]TWT09482.1 TRAP transporter large permease [Reyranella sp. CPCC 100927]